MPSPHAFVVLALSLVIFALSLSAAVLARPRESLYAVPGRPDAGERR